MRIFIKFVFFLILGIFLIYSLIDRSYLYEHVNFTSIFILLVGILFKTALDLTEYF